MNKSIAAWMLACAALSAHAQGLPQTAPDPTTSVDGMVRQLQGPRTRSMRNLVVESRPGAAPTGNAAMPAAEAPSLSLLIQFDFNSANVRHDSVPLVERLSQALRDPSLASQRFSIEGHTDGVGKPDYNLKLSERRAQAVKDMLVKMGVEGDRLASVGKGSSELANAADPRAPENRRVRVVSLN